MLYICPIKISLTPVEEQLFTTIKNCLKNRINIDPSKPRLTIRVAGGWVRDKILCQIAPPCQNCFQLSGGRSSSTVDIDLTVDRISGVEFAHLLCDYANSTSTHKVASRVGQVRVNPDQSKHLETACVNLYGLDIDVNHLRKEEYADSSRIPVNVEIGTPIEDARRRDLTINSLFYNVNEDVVEDWLGTNGGYQDLIHGVVQTPLCPKQTFLDDPLRILRTIRFATRYHFDISLNISMALEGPQGVELRTRLSNHITRERIGIEVKKMLIESLHYRKCGQSEENITPRQNTYCTPHNHHHLKKIQSIETESISSDEDAKSVEANLEDDNTDIVKELLPLQLSAIRAILWFSKWDLLPVLFPSKLSQDFYTYEDFISIFSDGQVEHCIIHYKLDLAVSFWLSFLLSRHLSQNSKIQDINISSINTLYKYSDILYINTLVDEDYEIIKKEYTTLIRNSLKLSNNESRDVGEIIATLSVLSKYGHGQLFKILCGRIVKKMVAQAGGKHNVSHEIFENICTKWRSVLFLSSLLDISSFSRLNDLILPIVEDIMRNRLIPKINGHEIVKIFASEIGGDKSKIAQIMQLQMDIQYSTDGDYDMESLILEKWREMARWNLD